MGYLFRSTRGAFERNNAALKDMIQGHMALDIDVAIKTTAGTPVKHGGLKSEVRHFKSANNQWRVESGKVYSAYQERGSRRDGTHKIKKYTTAGTSAGWFMRAIEQVLKNKQQYISEARRALNL